MLRQPVKGVGTKAKVNARDEATIEHVVEDSTQIARDHEANRKAVLSIEQKAGMQGKGKRSPYHHISAICYKIEERNLPLQM